MLLLILLFCVLESFVSPINGYSVIGGRNATKGEFPYIVSIYYCRSEECSHSCGGVILNEYWILTAAHCINKPPDSYYEIYAGFTNTEDPNKQVANVEKTIVHEGYDNVSDSISDKDIALIKLSAPLVFNELVQAASLPKEDVEDPIGEATLAGWGVYILNETHMIHPHDLQTVDLPIIDFESCMVIIHQEKTNAPDYNDSVVCTGPMSGGIGACFGDSGGPLTQNGTLIGLAAWLTMACAEFGTVNVFTKVSSYIPWIFDNINEN